MELAGRHANRSLKPQSAAAFRILNRRKLEQIGRFTSLVRNRITALREIVSTTIFTTKAYWRHADGAAFDHIHNYPRAVRLRDAGADARPGDAEPDRAGLRADLRRADPGRGAEETAADDPPGCQRSAARVRRQMGAVQRVEGRVRQHAIPAGAGDMSDKLSMHSSDWKLFGRDGQSGQPLLFRSRTHA